MKGSSRYNVVPIRRPAPLSPRKLLWKLASIGAKLLFARYFDDRARPEASCFRDGRFFSRFPNRPDTAPAPPMLSLTEERSS